MGRMRNDAPYCSVFWLCRRAVLDSPCWPTRISSDGRFRAAVKDIADIKRRPGPRGVPIGYTPWGRDRLSAALAHLTELDDVMV